MKNHETTTSGLEWNTMLGFTDQLRKAGHLRDYLLITLGCNFGLRISDLLSLRWEDVIDKDELLIQESKTKKKRRITINARVQEAVNFCLNKQKWQKNFKEENLIFTNRWGGQLSVSYINKRLKVLFIKYRVRARKASSHTLRKTFGKRVYEMDGQSERALIYLSEIFGHSSVAITRSYIGITQEEIADVYLKL